CQPTVILRYLRLTVWPDQLVLDYGWRPRTILPDAAVDVVIVAVMLGLSLWGWWRRHPLGYAAAMFWLLLAPTSSVVPVADLAMEHRMYLALAPVLAGVAGAASWLAGKHQRAAMAIALLVAAALTGRTMARVLDYRDEVSMWSSVARASPNHARAWASLGSAQFEAGRVAASIAPFEQALALSPRLVGARRNLAVALMTLGEDEQARRQLLMVVRMTPDDALALRLLGELAFRGRDVDGAEAWLARSLERMPRQANVLDMLARIAAFRGDWDQARMRLEEAMKADPDRSATVETLTIVAKRMAKAGQAVAAAAWLDAVIAQLVSRHAPQRDIELLNQTRDTLAR
ncbi:MAG: tetratricopeptide repeat protein, partial [Phycisphaeraceae bacterium]|nr:tetratricopeptide repeat protein [Phycisphaeraceae bacterium]